MDEVQRIDEVLDAVGLRRRGGFRVAAEDAVPPLPDGRPAATLILVGGVGGSLWPAFASSTEYGDGQPDPLDRWTARVLRAVAATLGTEGLEVVPLFPFAGPPYLPFQRWARRAEGLAVSPLGLLIHPDYGLWHAYRGALALATALPLSPAPPMVSPCDACQDRPCLSACPVAAFGDGFGGGGGFAAARCRGHLAGPDGPACLAAACLARRACPVGASYRYDAPQADFHMRAFLEAGD